MLAVLVLIAGGGRLPAGEAGTLVRGRPAVRLELDANRVVQAGEFLSGTETQTVKFEHPATGRFFCLESLSAQDGRAYAAVAELELLDAAGNSLDRTGWRIAYVDSEELEREEAPAENAVDGNPATYWHTQWGVVAPNHPHHLVLDLGRSQPVAGFRYTPRPGSGTVGGRLKDYRVYLGDDLVTGLDRDIKLPGSCHLFAYFTGGGEDGLHLAYSLNGYRWEAMNHGRSFLKPEVGGKLMRDPFLMRGPDGTFHLVWTAAWTGNAIGHASSPDLIHWSEQETIPVMAAAPGVVHCWAPEMVWDAGRQEFLIFWSSDFTNEVVGGVGGKLATVGNRLYCTTTRDFKSFSPSRLFFDPGFGINDATLVVVSNGFRLVFVDELRQRLNWATAAEVAGPYGTPGNGFGPASLEGPTVFRLGGQVVVSAHQAGGKGQGNRYVALKTSDWEHWEDISQGMFLPAGGQQGTALEVAGETLKPLLAAGLLQIFTTPEASELGIGNWIWTTNVSDRQICRLWRAFEIPKSSAIVRAELRLTADNGYTAFLDGVEIGRGGDAYSLTEYDLTWLLTPGRHVLAVEAFNDTLDAGVLLGLRIKLANGKQIGVFSDGDWRVAANDDRNWKVRKFSPPAWPLAQTVAYAGAGWWQYPFKIIHVPPTLPASKHFWQQTWFLVVLLLTCVLVGAYSLRQRLQLVVQNRSQQLLERERVRIARDLHDDLGAGLTQLTLLGELVRREMPAEGEVRSRMNDVCDKSRQLLRSIDEVVWVVNPKRDTVADFAAFMSEHAQEFLAATAIRCRQEVAEELPDFALDLPRRRNLLLAVKEAVRNAARHSGASEVNFILRVVDQRLEVVVEDNGKGFASTGAPSGRNGVGNMHQRLKDIGGTCAVVSAPGQGCRVTFHLPLVNRERS